VIRQARALALRGAAIFGNAKRRKPGRTLKGAVSQIPLDEKRRAAPVVVGAQSSVPVNVPQGTKGVAMPKVVKMSANRTREIPTVDELPAVLPVRIGDGEGAANVAYARRTAKTGSWGFGISEKVTLVIDGKPVEFQHAGTLTVIGSLPFEVREARKAARKAEADAD
jgi:hypothetical protein